MAKPSCAKLREMLKDEIVGAREYRKAGFKSLAKDESRHAKFIKKKLKKC